ncbi:hypothetical protein Tco_0646155 [Tanacetum coccineum]
MPSEYQQDYKKTHAYAQKIYNDPNMSEQLRDIFRILENRFIFEFYKTLQLDRDPSDNHISIKFVINYTFIISLAQFSELTNLPNDEICLYSDAWGPSALVTRENVYSAIGNRDHTQAIIALMLYCVETGNLKANMFEHLFDERYILIPGKMASLKAEQPKHPPPKRTRNLGKSKCVELPTSSSSDSPPSDNGDLPSTKLSPRSYYRAFPVRANMLEEQRETRGMFKNLARALHKFAKILKKGCRS